MSLYNALFGVNPLAPFLLKVLGLTQADCGRLRDCYFGCEEDGGEPRICVYTRNGGGNRPDYKEVTQALRAHPLYSYDVDDDFDCTYATYYFRVPEVLLPLAIELRAETVAPAERWKVLLDDLEDADADTPEKARALEVGREILGGLHKAMSEQGDEETPDE